MWTPFNLLSVESWLLIVTLLVLARYYIHRKWQYLRNMNIPHDQPSLRKLGHLMDFLNSKRAFQYDNEMKRKHGSIWGSYTMFSPAITIHDPDILRQIYIKEFHSFPVRQKRLTKVNGRELSEALLAVKGNQWKRTRSTLTPTFSTAKLREMMYIMDRCIDNAADALDRKIKSNNGVFNSKTIFLRLSLDILCSAAFSTDVNSQDDSVKEPEISIQAKKLFGGSMFSPLLLLCLIFPPFESVVHYFGLSIVVKEPVQYFIALTHHVINQRKSDPHGKNQRVDFMQLMLNSEILDKDADSGKVDKGMKRNEIIGNSMLMIIAGYENTGNAMSYLAYNLSHYPETQKKLQQEIDEMFEKYGKFDYDSVSSLKYMDMCVNETMRIYHPILRNARVCEKETTINGLTIPKGMTVNIPAYALANDPDYWDNPSEFRPERMEDMNQIDPMVFQPFGAGPRNCIGMRFALMEVKMCMAKLLHKFTFEPAEDTPKPPLKLKFGLNIKPAVDYDLRAVRRKNSDRLLD